MWQKGKPPLGKKGPLTATFSRQSRRISQAVSRSAGFDLGKTAWQQDSKQVLAGALLLNVIFFKVTPEKTPPDGGEVTQTRGSRNP